MCSVLYMFVDISHWIRFLLATRASKKGRQSNVKSKLDLNHLNTIQ